MIAYYQTVVMYACVAVLAVIAAVSTGWIVRRALRVAGDALGPSEVAVFAVLAGVCCWAAQKRLVSFPRTDPEQAYLVDRGSYVDDETSTVHIDFERIIAPDAAVLYVDRRQRREGAEWENYLTTTLGEFRPPVDIEVPNATNYNWLVYTDWTPGPSVVTNGVWHAMWGRDQRSGRHAIPIRTAVRVDGRTIATPKSKEDAKDE